MSEDKEDIAFCTHEVGKALSACDAALTRLSCLFAAHPEWNDEVKYAIRDAVVQLGFAAGSLLMWYDDPVNTENNDKS